MRKLLKSIPSVDSILSLDSIKSLIKSNGEMVVKKAVRDAIEQIRKEIIDGNLKEGIKEKIIEKVLDLTEDALSPSLKRVINGTGIVIHTNLGRSVISPKIMDYVKYIATHYNNLEYDLEQGKRGHRDMHAEKLLSEYFNVESATVVNNNAAAVLLMINTFAEGKEVVVSRGELIEIGGSFRIPEIMKKAGAKLVEVGTTNKTHLKDYEEAINEKTGLVLKVHPSNYRITGFTHSVPASQISKLCRERGVVFAEDMGSGNIYDLSTIGIQDEPDVFKSVREGIDLISFSGDKLFGCLQAGIIIGRKRYIDSLRKNHLLRALRVDKITYSAIESHLIEILKGNFEKIPVYNMVFEKEENIKIKVESFVERFKKKRFFTVIETFSRIGGGTTPEKEIKSFGLAFNLNMAPEKIDSYFRSRHVPVIGRIKDGKYILDFRTILDDDLDLLETYVSELLSSEV